MCVCVCVCVCVGVCVWVGVGVYDCMVGLQVYKNHSNYVCTVCTYTRT